MSDLVSAWNTGVNTWAKAHIYKRLSFLGSRLLSGLGTLLYLAVWHGLWSGYYHTFALELLEMEAEKRLASLPAPRSRLAARALPLLRWALCTMVLHYGLISFELRDWRAWVAAYKSLYWLGHLAPCLILLLPRRHIKQAKAD